MGRRSRAPKTKRAHQATTGRVRAPMSASQKPDSFSTLVAATAQILKLPIDPAWRKGVERNLKLLHTHAALIDEFLLPDEVEQAPVFRA